MFEQENDPHYYGDVLSFLVRAGGMYMKTSAIGTIPFEKKAGSV